MGVVYLKTLSLTLYWLLVLYGGAWASAFVDSRLGIAGYRSAASAATGILLLLLGTALRGWASYTFYANRLSVVRIGPQAHILETGPYARSRNPLYLGLLALAVGWVLFLGSVTGLLLSCLFFLLVDLWIRKEERDLQQRFGEEYTGYRTRVPRWGWARRATEPAPLRGSTRAGPGGNRD